MILTLKPLTKKGKDRLKRWGETWNVLEQRGNRVKVASTKDTSTGFLPDSVRWIELKADPDFEIVGHALE